MTDIYIPRRPQPGSMYAWTLTQDSCKVNSENWRLCAANAEARGDVNQVLYCEAKAQKIAGWLDDLMEADHA